MATYNDFVNSINRLLNLTSVQQTLSLNPNATEKAFEVYILTLIVEALRRVQGAYTIIGINTGPNPNPIVFRAAPGCIYSRRRNFAYLDCELNDKEFEIHEDVEFEGSSGATHEVDVVIIDKKYANRFRDEQINARYPILVIECKFFSSSIPTTGVARALVGLLSDFHVKMGSIFVSNDATDNLKLYLSNKNRPDPFTDIDPLNIRTEELFISSIEFKLKKWASI